MNYEEMVRSLTAGETYRVKMDDCCVVGEFTSKLKEKQVVDEREGGGGEDYPTLVFENGVVLETFWGCVFEKVEKEGKG